MSRSLEQLYSDTDTPSGLLVHCDYLLVIKTMERQIQGWYAQIWEGDIHSKSLPFYILRLSIHNPTIDAFVLLSQEVQRVLIRRISTRR